MTNLDSLRLLQDVDNLIELGKKKIFQIVDPENQEKTTEIREIEPFIVFPPKVAYTLLKNKNSLTKITEKKEKIATEIKDTFLKEENFDKAKYESDKDYAKELDQKLEKIFKDNSIITEFLKDESKYKPYVVKVSLKETKDEDIVDVSKNVKFDITYIPESIFDKIIVFV